MRILCILLAASIVAAVQTALQKQKAKYRSRHRNGESWEALLATARTEQGRDVIRELQAEEAAGAAGAVADPYQQQPQALGETQAGGAGSSGDGAACTASAEPISLCALAACT